MSAYYDLYETLDVRNTGKKQSLHARIVSSGTIAQKDFVERISRHIHFSRNIIDGVLGVAIDELADLLADGYTVEFGELGYLSSSLKCMHEAMNRKGIRAESIRFDNVHLRTSTLFKTKMRYEMKLERVPNSKQMPRKAGISIEQRLQMVQDFLKKNGGITRIEYSRLTKLSRHQAIDDLNAFVEQKKLRKRGAGRTTFYVWMVEE